MLKRFFLVFALLFLGVSGINVLPVQAAAPGKFVEADCKYEFDLDFYEIPTVVCGYLTVPSNHAEPNGKELRLGVVIFKAENPLPDPVFMAQGGPGGSTIDTYANILLTREAFRGNRDFVLLEQRGTLRSKPALYCREYDDLVLQYLDVDLPLDEFNRMYLETMLQCRERLVAQGAQLSDFDSYENARDIEALRLALGYEKINLYGVSYGSLLAQHYMRLYPGSLRSVILDGVVAPQNNIFLDSPANQQRAFRHLFDSCAADEACNRHYPNLEKVFYGLVDQLDANPVRLTLRDNKTQQSHPAILDGYALQGILFQSLYASDFARTAPHLLYSAKQGDYAVLSAFVSLVTFDRTMSYGMYFSVMCAEDADFAASDLDLSKLEPRIAEFNRTSAVDALEFCNHWNVEALGPETDQEISSDIPTLLLSGSFDPVTPASNAQLAAAGLSRSYLYEFPRGGHGQLFDSDCADSVIGAFWENPSQAPDASCITQSQEPLFYGHGSLVFLPFVLRIINADLWLLLEGGVLALAALFLASSIFVLPLIWLVRLFNPAQNRPRPALVLYFSGGLAWLNTLVIGLFLGIVAYIFFDMALNYDNLVIYGFYASTRPVFLLPWLSLLLTVGMLALLVVGWRSQAWSIWRKLYYTFLSLSALVCVAALAWWQMFGVLFS